MNFEPRLPGITARERRAAARAVALAAQRAALEAHVSRVRAALIANPQSSSRELATRTGAPPSVVRSVQIALDLRRSEVRYARTPHVARERVTRALTAARLTADGHTPAQVAAALGCSIETVGNLIADGGFYEAPAGDQRRLELARAAAVMLATGKTRAQVISALAGSGAHRAVRDAGALTILNRLDES